MATPDTPDRDYTTPLGELADELEAEEAAQDARDDAQDAETDELRAALGDALERIDDLEDGVEPPPPGPVAPGPVTNLEVDHAGWTTWDPPTGAPTTGIGYDVALDGQVIAVIEPGEALELDLEDPGAGHVVAVRAFVADPAQADGRLEGPAVTATVPTAPPGPGPSDTVSTLAELLDAIDNAGLYHLVGDFVLEEPLIVPAGVRLSTTPGEPRARLIGANLDRSEGFAVHTAGDLLGLIVRGNGLGDRGCVEVRGAARLFLVDLLDGGGNALAAFGGDDTPHLDGVFIDRYAAYAAYLQGDLAGVLAIGSGAVPGRTSPDFAGHIYGTQTRPSANLGLLRTGGGRITCGGPGGIGTLTLRADLDNPGSLRSSAVQAGYGGSGGGTANIDVRCNGAEYGVEVSGPWSNGITVRSRGHINGPALDWGAGHLANATLVNDGPLGAAAYTHPLDGGAGHVFVALWNGAPVPAGMTEVRELSRGPRLRVVHATAA